MRFIYSFLGYALLATMAISCSKVEFNNDPCANLGPKCVINPRTNRPSVDDSFNVPINTKMVDVLFVVDNSKSMMADQGTLAARFSTFFSKLSGVDWHIAITTTDMRNEGKDYQNGKLVPFLDGNGSKVTNVLSSSDPSPTSLFSNTVRRQETSDCVWYFMNGQPWKCKLSGDERGIFAATTAIQRNEYGFIRPGADLHVVFLSDEDERSNGGLFSGQPMISGQDFAENLVNLGTNMGKNLYAHSIVIQPGDSTCLNNQKNNGYNDSAFEGTEYSRASELTGGVKGDICAGATDYSNQLKTIGNIVQNPDVSQVQLACVPTGGKVTVTINATIYDYYNITERVLDLNPVAHPGDDVRVQYECPEVF